MSVQAFLMTSTCPPASRTTQLPLFFRQLGLLLVLTFLAVTFATQLARAATESRIPAALDPAINHLLQLVGQDNDQPLVLGKTTPLIDFIVADKDETVQYYPEDLDNTTASYYQFDLDTSMESLLGYAYNPALPVQLVSPSSLRLAYLLPENSRQTSWSWTIPGSQQQPQIVRYAEHEEITPDLFTGAYYGYDVDRTMILGRYQGRNVFFSLSRQRDRSDVGKKGAVLGEDGNWDFLYSGKPGINRTGLSWVKSYMYKSFSITVFYELPGDRPRLRCGVFKWLNAGWAQINMVQRKHLQRGLARYASDMKKVIETENLPSPEQLQQAFSRLRSLDADTVQAHLTEYLLELGEKYKESTILKQASFKDLLTDNHYLEILTVQHMLAMLEIEYLKGLMGRPFSLPRGIRIPGLSAVAD